MNLTPSKAGYIRMLKLIIAHSPIKEDVKACKAELAAFEAGATYMGGLE